MNRQIARVILGLTAVAACSLATAKLQAPDHVIYGNATIFGVDAPLGSVIELREMDGDVLARYELGRESRLGNQYALYIPMDTVDPREDGHARKGDQVEIFIGAQLAARTQVGDEGVAVRLDIDPQNMGTGPAIRVDPIQVMEGNSGLTTARFTLLMNTTAPDRVVKVNWQTAADTATAGASCTAGVDYITRSGQASIPAGQLQAVVDISVCGDTTIEPNELFNLQLTGTEDDFGVIQDASVQATILDDDDLPAIHIADVRVLEPQAGSAPANFQVTLSRSSAVDVSVDYATVNVTAMAGADFTNTSGNLVIPAGDTTASISVEVLADATVEPQETFRLALSNPQAAGLATAFATGSIVDPKYDPALTEQDETNSDGDAGGQLVQPGAIAISADGLFAYATSEAMDSVLLFSRDTQNGQLTYITAYSAGGVGAPLDGVRDVVISPDDKHVYVAGSRVDVVTEVLGHGQAGQRDAQTVARWLVHLAVDHRHLRLREVVRAHDLGFDHLVVEVVALTGTLTHASEHRQTAVLGRDVVDQLEHVDGLADAGTAEQANLAALGERAHQVDDLDAGFQQLVGGRLVLVARCRAVDFPAVGVLDRTDFVNRVTEHVHDATQRRLADRHGDRLAGVGGDQATLEAVGGAQSDRAHHAVTQLLLHFQRDLGAFDLQCVIHLRHVRAGELDVHHRTDDLNDLALAHFICSG